MSMKVPIKIEIWGSVCVCLCDNIMWISDCTVFITYIVYCALNSKLFSLLLRQRIEII